MNNNEALNEFFVWEENNSTDLNQNLLKNAEQDKCVTTTETKTNVENLHWKDITDPKLRKKMRDKAWREDNKNHIKNYNSIYNKNNKDKKKNWRNLNKNRINEQRRMRNKFNKNKKPISQHRKDWQKNYQKNNRDKINAYSRSYYHSSVKHRYKKRDTRNKYRKNCYKTNIQYKLSDILRGRVRSKLRGYLNGNCKIGSAVKDLGCTLNELKTYLESNFQPGMTWNNWNRNGWHIDHIKPLASFDLTDRNQFLKACHYTNLQPLWAKDNLAKSDKIIPQAV